MAEKLIFPYNSENMQKNWEDIRNVYEHIVDEQSRQIYIYRLLLTFTGDVKYIRKLILSTDVGRKFERFLNVQNKIYVYGAGIRGNRLVQMFPEMKWKNYIDKKCEGICNGIGIIKPQNIKLEKDAIILITNYEGFAEIKENLIKLGIEEKQIVCMNDFEIKAQENQYFEERCIKYFKNTSGNFIDAGCFDGRDCIRFLESGLGNNASIYAFEPDEANYQECKKALSNYKNIEIFNIGLADAKGKESFLSEKGEKARVTCEGNCFIQMDTIDHLVGDNKIGFIKMDIEGSEKKALVGAKSHIEQDRPNMMISIYHKIEDAIEIPKLLLDINPKYRFSFGHYSIGSASDTVLYVFE